MLKAMKYELIALKRQYFDTDSNQYLGAFIGFCFIFLIYTGMIFFKTFIENYEITVINSIFVFSVVGFFLSDFRFEKYLKSDKNKFLVLLPYRKQQLLLFKSIKYEVLSGAEYAFCLLFVVIPFLMISKSHLYILFIFILSCFSFLMNRKIASLFKLVFSRINSIDYLLKFIQIFIQSVLLFIFLTQDFQIIERVIRKITQSNKWLIAKTLTKFSGSFLILVIIGYTLLSLLYVFLCSMNKYNIKNKREELWIDKSIKIGTHFIIKNHKINPLLKKEIQLMENAEIIKKITVNGVIFLFSLLLVFLNCKIQHIALKNISLLSVLLIVSTFYFTNFTKVSSFTLSEEQNTILNYIQSKYPMMYLLRNKIISLFTLNIVLSFIIILVLFLTGLCNFLTFIGALFISGILLLHICITNVYYTNYKGKFLNDLMGVSIVSSVMFVIVSSLTEYMLLFCLFLGEIFHTNFLGVFSLVFMLTVSIVLHHYIFKRKVRGFYGEYSKIV
ncbi:MAG: hypothetical protein LBM95_01225 [Lactobacillales bacterium]|jgi:hypothetical protein|nr:hypothetical protein [Lactobacillales bacterium]